MTAPTQTRSDVWERTTTFAVRHRSILIVVVIGFVLRVAWLAYANPAVVSDYREYLGSAQVLRRYGQYGYPTPTAHRLPLYPVLLAGLLIVSSSTAWLAFWSVVLSTAICPLLYLVARRTGISARVALIAALIYAVLPNFVFYAPVLASEFLLAVLVLAALLVVTSVRLGPPVRFLLAGVLIGAATLTRGDGLVYGLIALVWGVAVVRSELHVTQWSNAFRVIGMFSLGVLVVLTPWLVRNEVVVGRGTLLGGNSAIAFYYAHNPLGVQGGSDPRLAGLDESARQREAWRLSFDYLRDDPLSVIGSTRRSTASVFGPNTQFYGVYWSTRDVGNGLYPFPTRADRVRAWRFGRSLSVAGSWFLTIVPVLALLNPGAVGRRMLCLVAAVVGSIWLFYSVVFIGTARYRFMADVFLCLAAAAVLVLVWHAGRRGKTLA